jgi:hypothetical protein
VDGSGAPEQSTVAEQVATIGNLEPKAPETETTNSASALTAAADSSMSGGIVSNGFISTETLKEGASKSESTAAKKVTESTITMGKSASISIAVNLNSTLTNGPGGYQASNENTSTSATKEREFTSSFFNLSRTKGTQTSLQLRNEIKAKQKNLNTTHTLCEMAKCFFVVQTYQTIFFTSHE